MSSVVAVRWSFYAFLVALPFGTRKLLFQFTPGFHEYETAAIYAADLFLAVFVAVALIHAFKNRSGGNFKFQISNFKTNLKSKIVNVQTVLLVVFLFFAGVSIFFATSKGLALYSFARLLTAAAFAAAVAYALRQGLVRLRHIFGILAASAVLQSLIAFAQFVKQGSVGLRFLGEPMLSAQAIGIAKFTAEGGKILRAYGTFPHPNILGAFLVLGLLSCVYLWFVSPRHSEAPAEESPEILQPTSLGFRMTLRVLALTASVFLVLLGLVLTFSRSAWFVAIISSSALLLYGFAHSDLRRRASLLLFTLVASGYTLVAVLSPFIFPRAQILATEPSVVQRVEYNRLGVALIAQHPFGVGLGNQVLYGVTNGLYEKFGMTKAWQWEPIHNIYLLIGSEIGILGLIVFVALLFALLCHSEALAEESRRSLPAGRQASLLRMTCTTERIVAASMLVTLLLFGLADHFLWTLRPGQLLLWLVIGLVWGTAGRENLLEVE